MAKAGNNSTEFGLESASDGPYYRSHQQLKGRVSFLWLRVMAKSYG